MNEYDLTHPLLKTGIYVGGSIILTLFLVFGGCTMHSNTFDGERLRGEAEIERTITEREIAASKARQEDVATIERLVLNGTHPVAARCAVMGWNATGRETCLLAGADVK